LVATGLVAGCGSAATTTHELAPLPPLSVSRAGGGAAAALFPVPGNVEYRVGSLPSLPASATAYRVAATTTTARVTRLAAAFGITAAVTADASGWTATAGDTAVHVDRLGGLPWTFSGNSGGGVASSGCAVAEPATTPEPANMAGPANAAVPPETAPVAPSVTAVTAPGPSVTAETLPVTPETVPPVTCPPPTTVPGLPTQDAAVQTAKTVLSKAGLDLQGATFTASGGEADQYVTVTPTVAGVNVASSSWGVDVGPNGDVLSASGWLGEPVAAGDYPLVGLTEGVRRLEAGAPWIVFGGPGPVPMIAAGAGGGLAAGAGGVATPSAGPDGAATPGAGGGGSAGAGNGGASNAGGAGGGAGNGGAGGAPVSTGPATPPPAGVPTPGPPSPCPDGAPCPTVPPVVRTVTGARLGLGWAWPADGAANDAWLLPVYLFNLDDGQTVAVLAVDNRYLTGPSSTTTEVSPATKPVPDSTVVPPVTPAPTPAQPAPTPAQPAPTLAPQPLLTTTP
jgi:hypothetical protein